MTEDRDLELGHEPTWEQLIAAEPRLAWLLVTRLAIEREQRERERLANKMSESGTWDEFIAELDALCGDDEPSDPANVIRLKM
jgi:hypothetical protein